MLIMHVSYSQLRRRNADICSFLQFDCWRQEHVGWEHAHVVGHSMGAMIALKLAAAHPERIDSLTLVSATCGHFESIPRSWRALWYSLQVRLIRGNYNTHACDRWTTTVARAYQASNGCLASCMNTDSKADWSLDLWNAVGNMQCTAG